MVIVLVTMSLWSEPHRGRHHYARVLSKKHTVLWVNRFYKKGEKNPRHGLEHICDGLYVLHVGKPPIPASINSRLNLNNIIRYFLLKQTIRLNNSLGSPDIVWIYDYSAGFFVDRFRKTARTLYFCNDYFGEPAFRLYEKKLAGKVDFVITTAPELKKRFEGINPNTWFLPHGTDLPSLISKSNQNNKPQNAGYIGTLREIIDIDFIENVLTNTSMTIILAGPIINCSQEKERRFRDLFERDRVEYLGNMDRQSAFDTMIKCDVLLLPYVRTFKTRHNFVIKYFEYLSTGNPIIATSYFDWPKPYNEFVNVYDGVQSVREYIENVYRGWDVKKRERAIAFAKENTWDRRISQISQIMQCDI
jgi:hypothetical protein